MKKTLVLGDVHISAKEPNKFQGVRDLLIDVNFHHIYDVVVKKKIKVVVLNGDIYDDAFIAHSRKCILTNFLMELIFTTDVEVYIIPGNHDKIGEENPYQFLALQPRIHICSYTYRTKDMLLIPWGGKIPKHPSSGLRLVIAHLDCMSTVDGKLTKTGKKIEKFVGDNNLAVIGHIHTPEVENVKNLIFPGALVTNGFDERRRGAYVIIEGGKRSALRSKIHIAPAYMRYVTVDLPELTKKNNKRSTLATMIYHVERFINKWRKDVVKQGLAIRVLHDEETAYDAKKFVQHVKGGLIKEERDLICVFSKNVKKVVEDSNFEEIAKEAEGKLDVIVRGGKEYALRKYFKEKHVSASVADLCIKILEGVTREGA